MKKDVSLETIVSLCKRRGFIFPGSELYNGLAGTYDYGPLGALLKENIKRSWLDHFVYSRTNMYLVDAAILMNQKVWQATGHVDEFHDPLVEDTKTKKRYRADHLLAEAGIADAEALSPDEMTAKIRELGLTSPDGNPLGEVQQFNMMLATKMGASEGSANTTYLRPETAQGIFVNYKNVMDSMSPKIPFGIAQIGKAFRNEITPRDFTFRVREMEQMEIEFFVHPDKWAEHFDSWRVDTQIWIKKIGIASEKLHVVEIPDGERAHYSDRTIDFEFEFPFGQKELFGPAYRADFDLSRHAEYSKTKLQYTDPVTNETYVPHVIEPSFGLDRIILALLTSAYREDTSSSSEEGEARVYLDLPVTIAPYLIAVSPLLKNKPELVARAEAIFGNLKMKFGRVVWDDNGNIGKRYRRQDEIGTPFCIVVDFETLEGQEVTIRHRNTTEQVRVPIEELETWIHKKMIDLFDTSIHFPL